MTTLLAPRVPLAHGATLPRMGLGTWPMTDDEAEVAVARAIETGYRLVDTAYKYGNERGVGKGLRAAGVPREELFVTTKLNGEWHGLRESHEAFAASADRLGLDYVDMYLIHWPLPWKDRYVEAWKGLAALLENGRVRAIGVSNFKPVHIDRLLAETGVLPDVNQIQLNPAVGQARARESHRDRGIAVQSWSPLGRGGNFLGDPAVTTIAERYGKTPAQVVLRWHLDLGLNPVAKSGDPQRMRENLDVFDFSLTADEIAVISGFDRGEEAAVDSDATGH
jgi:2,5-diketo-D-gluconate reductase A